MATRHEEETECNRRVWNRKPLLRAIYRDFQRRIAQWIEPSIPGAVIEIGSGIGNLSELCPQALLTERWLEPWIDLCCDAFHLPLAEGAASHLVLFDVFHHLSAPAAFLDEAARAVPRGGRVIVFEPYISLTSAVVYGAVHEERIGWRAPIPTTPTGDYYAAQGNATRLFFRDPPWMRGWQVLHREAFATFAYLLSGGFSWPALFPLRMLPLLNGIDRSLSRLPKVFAARCLIVLARS